MAGLSFRVAAFVALLAVVLYQTVLRDLAIKFGMGRVLQSVTDFPYQCRRLSHPGLEACEDMWLDETHRQLYLACSNVASRRSWIPALGRFNESALLMDDGIYVLDIDGPVTDKPNLRRLTMPGFYGQAGEDDIHLLGMSGRLIPGSSKIELYLVNMKPTLADSASGSGKYADNIRTGANMTIELFELESGASSMSHVRTFAHELIATPNNVAPLPDGSGFYISNDHGLNKAGLKHTLSPLLATGNIVHCTHPPAGSTGPLSCSVVATGLSAPNGLAISAADPKTLYVPSTGLGKGVYIFNVRSDGGLSLAYQLQVPYPLDNLSPSGDGSIYAAGFPSLLTTLKHWGDPEAFAQGTPVANRKSPPAIVLKIDKLRNLVNDGQEVTWSWEKVIEDATGHVLPPTTAAARDSKTGKLFMTGVTSYFITVCDPI